jgi:tetratricopeptide (TPR) repeat protein
MMIEEVDGNEVNEVIEPTIVKVAPIVKENLVQREDTPRAHTHNRIILFNILKNESKIAKRMLAHVLPHVDAVAILDTGSTDNTIDVLTESLEESGKPYQIAQEPFKNFGHNRTISFQKGQELCKKLGWDPETTYGLTIDGDMCLVSTPAFKDYLLKDFGYTLIQSNGAIVYDNSRFFQLSKPWKCVGGTHEYWDYGQTSRIPKEVMYIDDKNDGQFKSQKYTRDLELLQADIDENPKNARAHYYMGQTLKDLGRFEDAIVMFKKRFELGAWIEESWYALLQIGKCYDHLNKPHEMELWMNKAFEYHPKRAEPLYHLTRYFREKSQHYKAYHYYLKGKDIPYPKDDLLFVEHAVYNGLFPYEATILDCYVTGKSKQDSLADLIGYINKGFTHYIDNVWSNLPFYVEPLTSERYRGEYSRMLLPSHAEYRVSSCCIAPYSNTDPLKRYVMNTRYVNYTISLQTGAYSYPDGKVRTKNGRVFLNSSYQPTGDVALLTEDYHKYDSNIEGLEDVRIFYHEGRLKCFASSKNITNDGNIVIALGDYDAEQSRISNLQVVKSPRDSNVEKNWIQASSAYLTKLENYEQIKDKLNVIYGWSPFEIGAVETEDGVSTLRIHTTYATNNLFRHCRGSSPLVEYNGKLYSVVHFVKYVQPRQYYHSVVEFNRGTLKPERYTVPFAFCDVKIEYCLGFDIKNDVATFMFSRNDADPSMIRVPFGNLRMQSIFS